MNEIFPPDDSYIPPNPGYQTFGKKDKPKRDWDKIWPRIAASVSMACLCVIMVALTIAAVIGLLG